jgi:aryl-alcohol dehydrogenase-like predicted oxidoreductase
MEDVKLAAASAAGQPGNRVNQRDFLARSAVAGAFDETKRFDKDDFRASTSRFAPDNLKANMALPRLVAEWAKRKEATMAQVSLAWLQAQKVRLVAVVGSNQALRGHRNVCY